MIRLYFVVEGATEQTFVSELLRDHLQKRGIEVGARLIGKPGHKGGAVTYARATRDVVSHLRYDKECYCTTFLDFNGRGTGWPEIPTAAKGSLEQKAQSIEQAFHSDIVKDMGHTFRPERFIPYIQMHEFEGLLFSAPEALASMIGKPELEGPLRAIRAAFPTPEDINDGVATAPSKRIRDLARGYDKVFQGNLVALEIGLTKLRKECPHFHAWIRRIESLGGV